MKNHSDAKLLKYNILNLFLYKVNLLQYIYLIIAKPTRLNYEITSPPPPIPPRRYRTGTGKFTTTPLVIIDRSSTVRGAFQRPDKETHRLDLSR